MENTENDFIFFVGITPEYSELDYESDGEKIKKRKLRSAEMEIKCQLTGEDFIYDLSANGEMSLNFIRNRYNYFIETFERQGDIGMNHKIVLYDDTLSGYDVSIKYVYEAVFEWMKKIYFARNEI